MAVINAGILKNQHASPVQPVGRQKKSRAGMHAAWAQAKWQKLIQAPRRMAQHRIRQLVLALVRRIRRWIAQWFEESILGTECQIPVDLLTRLLIGWTEEGFARYGCARAGCTFIAGQHAVPETGQDHRQADAK